MSGLRSRITKNRIAKLIPATIMLLQSSPVYCESQFERAVERKNTIIIAMKMPIMHSISIAIMVVRISAKVRRVYSSLYSARVFSRCQSALTCEVVLSVIYSCVYKQSCLFKRNCALRPEPTLTVEYFFFISDFS